MWRQGISWDDYITWGKPKSEALNPKSETNALVREFRAFLLGELEFVSCFEFRISSFLVGRNILFTKLSPPLHGQANTGIVELMWQETLASAENLVI